MPLDLLEIVRSADGLRTVDEDGNEETLRLLEPATAEEIDLLRGELPCPLPPVIEELLRLTRGFDNSPIEELDFAGVTSGLDLGLDEVFPHPLAIAHDGFGNFWAVDLTAESIEWGPVYFVCHDPPVVVYQSPDLAHFLTELLRLANPPHESELDTVHEQHSMNIWQQGAGGLSVQDCLSSPDQELVQFARSLDEDSLIFDLRQPKIGDGFAWGRADASEGLRRHGLLPIFAYRPKKSWLRRLLERFGA